MLLATANQSLRVIALGATLTNWTVRTTGAGEAVDVLLGFDDEAAYRHAAATDNCYIGCVCGRYAGRVRRGRFALPAGVDARGAREVQLDVNNGDNCLHGGRNGWDKREWTVVSAAAESVTLSLHSPAGDMGFPGAVEATVTYTLSDQAGLRIDFAVRAVGDEASPVNITSHAYFNLGGLRTRDAMTARLQLHANEYVPLDPHTLCPRPEQPLAPVAGTPVDFRQPRPIADDSVDRATFAGFDVSFAVRDWRPDGQLRHVAHLYEPATGLAMDVHSTAPDAHLYTGYYLTGALAAKAAHRTHAHAYGRFSGLCLELQQFPDAPNQPAYPSTLVRPGETVRQTTVYRVFAAAS